MRAVLRLTVLVGVLVVVGSMPAAAQAATNCVVSAGVIQTDTTVTGTVGDDTIDCTGADRVGCGSSRR